MKKVVLMLVMELMLLCPTEETNLETAILPSNFAQTVTTIDYGEKDHMILPTPKINNKIDEQVKDTITPPKEVKEREDISNVSRQDSRKKGVVFEATAYCSCVKCCGKSDGITKSGVKVHKGTLAVDPRVIPLGTKVYIEGMGWFIAEDTGNFSGRRVDIYMETHEKALQFGRQKVKVVL